MKIGTFEAKNTLSATERPAPKFGSEANLVEFMADDFTAPLDDFLDYAPRSG